MARIPTLTDSPRVSAAAPLQPTLSAREAAAPFQQRASLAGQVAGSMFQLQRKQQAEADKVSYSKNNIALSQSFNEVAGQIEQEYRVDKPNHEGFAVDAMERMKVHRDLILEQTPESVKASTALAFDQKMLSYENRFSSTESSKKSEFARIETKNTIDELSHSSYSSWSPMDTLENSTRLKNLVVNSSEYDQKGKQVLLNQIDNVNKDMLNGVIDREDPVEMRQALSDMESEDLGLVFQSMDPEVVTKARARLIRKLDYKNNEGIKEVKGKFSDSVSALSKGTLNPNNPQHSKILNNVKNEIITRLGEDGVAMVDTIEAYETAADLSSDNAFTIGAFDPDAESKEIVSDQKDPLKRAGSQAKVKSILQSQKASMQKELAKDPASYVMKHDAGISLQSRELLTPGDPSTSKDYLNAMDSRYDQLQVPKHQRKYLNKTLKDHYGGAMKKFIDSGDAESASTVINEFADRFGEDAFLVYDELGIPDKYMGVLEITDPEARTRVMRNIMNEKDDINPRYKDHGLFIKDDEIKSTLRKGEMYQAIMGQDAGTNTAAGKNAEALLGMAQVEYKSAILNGSDKEEAEVKAWERVSSKYDIIENGAFPMTINNEKHDSIKAKTYIDNHTKADIDYVNLYDLRVAPGASMEATNNQFKDGATWTYNRKSDSLRLVVHQDGSWRQAVNRAGESVSIPLSDIDKMEGMKKSDKFFKSRREIFTVGEGIAP